MPQLRADQMRVVRAVETQFAVMNRRLCVQMPTGAGKTIVAAEITRRLGSRRILYVVPSPEIFSQTADKLRAVGIHPTLLQAGTYPDLRNARCVLAMSQTLANRLAQDAFDRWHPDVVIVDEAHRLIDQHANVLQIFNAASIALTATPVRLDGRGLRNLWPTLIEGPSVPELQRIGALVPRIDTIDLPLADLRRVRKRAGDYDSASLANAYEQSRGVEMAALSWLRHGRGRPTLAFTPTRKLSEELADNLRRLGIRAEHLDANTSVDHRKATLAKLKSRELEVITNCALFVEGVDVPEISCIVVCTSTLSLSKWLQMCGRGTRTANNKRDLIILDHGLCARRLGPVDCLRDWSYGGMPLHKETQLAQRV